MNAAAAAADRAIWVGRAAALGAVAIWACWLVASRYGVTGSLGPADVTFFRFVVPALVLWPFLFRAGSGFAKGERATSLAMIVGAGTPFFLIATTGMQFVPMSHIAALMPGTVPLLAALIAFAAIAERPDRWRAAGIVLIVGGIVLIVGSDLLDMGDGRWRGDLLLLIGAALWGGFTVALRRKGTDPWHAAAIVNVWSAVLFLPLYLFVFTPRILVAPWTEVAIQFVAQGLFSGIIAMVLYGIAVGRLGAGRAAAFNALLPALATLIGIPVLGEWPGPAAIGGIVLASAGVLLATGTVGAGRRG